MNKQMLEVAINLFGLNHEATISISQKLDEEIAREQLEIYKKFKEEV